MNDIKPGDLVLVASGPHFLRHGQVIQGIPTTLTHSGLRAPPAGFAFVQFMNRHGKLQKRDTDDGAPVDCVRVDRLRLAMTVQQQNQTTDLMESGQIKKTERRAAAEDFARRCIVEANRATS